MDATFAYLSDGRLYVKDGDQPARLIDSHFAQDITRAALEVQQKREWKTQGFGASFIGERR